MEGAENRADHGLLDPVSMVVRQGILLAMTIAELERLLTIIASHSDQPEEGQPLPGAPTLTSV